MKIKRIGTTHKLLAMVLLSVSIAFSGSCAYCAEGANGAEQSEQNLITAVKRMRASGRVQFNFKDLEIIQLDRKSVV